MYYVIDNIGEDGPLLSLTPYGPATVVRCKIFVRGKGKSTGIAMGMLFRARNRKDARLIARMIKQETCSPAKLTIVWRRT